MSVAMCLVAVVAGTHAAHLVNMCIADALGGWLGPAASGKSQRWAVTCMQERTVCLVCNCWNCSDGKCTIQTLSANSACRASCNFTIMIM